jgi:hypothetical protein
LTVKRSLLAAFAVVLSLFVPAALAWPGSPKTPSPTPPQLTDAPPPAWIETQANAAWLFYGSYCWQTACIDMIPPQSRPGVPVFTVARGATIRVHLGFAAKHASVRIDRRIVRTRLDSTKRIVSWPAGRAGILIVSARAGAGGASYVARLQVR